jgi:hypothetical protein
LRNINYGCFHAEEEGAALGDGAGSADAAAAAEEEDSAKLAAEAAAAAEASARLVAMQDEMGDGVAGGDSLLTGSEEFAPSEIDQIFS